MPETDKHIDERLRGMIGSGAEIAGGAIAGAIGFLAGGPAGAAVLGGIGTMAAGALRQVGEEVSNRLLGPREKVRAGAILALTAAAIQDRQKQGKTFRSDGFFDDKGNGRSDGEEVAEDIVSKAQREAEEKKLPFMANLLANIAFDEKITPEMAHQLSKIVESLTYRQLVILAAVPHTKGLRQADYRSQGNFSIELRQVLYEVFDLLRREFLNNGGTTALGIVDIIPAKLAVQGLGSDLYNLMELWKVDHKEMEKAIRILA